MPTVPKPYKASLSKTQGRQSYSIIFRHPVRKDPNTGKTRTARPSWPGHEG